MSRIETNGIEIEYDVTGDPAGRPLLLIGGGGAQLISWPDEFCATLVAHGHRVVRFDNRDAGLSTTFDEAGVNLVAEFLSALGGGPVNAPYALSDMANDALGLMDHLGIAAAHVVGASIGGMIGQTLAIEAPERTLSLTSIMSSSGDPDVGQPSPEMIAELISGLGSAGVVPTRADVVEAAARSAALIQGAVYVDEDRARAQAAEAFDRSYRPDGIGRQILAMVAGGSRREALASLSLPVLVIHGRRDPLIQVDGGIRTAESVPGARLLVFDDMGHDLPPELWTPITQAIAELTASASSRV